ncbi:tetratricopeptide repeat protein [Anaerolineales bacterium HSG24]|nr:tetratricopeptide repeat protein [Anaerolineales bacterium HSG24]
MPTFIEQLTVYEQALTQFKTDSTPTTLLTLLLARDALANLETSLQVTELENLSQLDNQFRTATRALPENLLTDYATWRTNHTQAHPEAWWWQLDAQYQQQQVEQDTFFIVITGVFVLITIPFAVEIIKRLWDGAPDIYSIGGTLLTLLLTGGSLSQKVRQLGNWLLTYGAKKIGIKRSFYAEIGMILAIIGWVLVMSFWVWGLPDWAHWYNDQGFASLQTGNIAKAEDYFRRSVALNPDEAVPYYNLGQVYHDIAQPKVAIEWYQQALQQNYDFAPAYQGLGRLYNEQGKHDQAETILLAGLERLKGQSENKATQVTRYYLLNHLGWAYFEQEKYILAEEVLTDTIELEPTLRQFELAERSSYRQALPHIYLAELYEQQENWSAAKQQWEQCIALVPLDSVDKQQLLLCQERFNVLDE